jgi:carboxymethylenebutenolidase
MEGREQPPAIDAVFDEHMAQEFQHRDVEATMRTMITNPYVNQVPVMTGGYGYEEVERFYRHHFIPKWPLDTSVEPISRTLGRSRWSTR